MQAIDKREKRTDLFYPDQSINPTGINSGFHPLARGWRIISTLQMEET
jgi:hypothetical protein